MILPPPTVCLLLLFLCSLALPIVASMPLSLLSVSLLLLFSFLPSLFFSPNPTLPLPSSISVSSSPFSSLLSPFPLLHYPSLLSPFLLIPLSSCYSSLCLSPLPRYPSLFFPFLRQSGTMMGLLWDSEKLEKMMAAWKKDPPPGELKYNSYFGDVKM